MRLLSFILIAGASLAVAQTPAPPPAFVLANDKLELTITLRGGAMNRLVLKGDPDLLSPFGDPAVMGRALGHFVCVDGFGDTSREERAAGLPGHGEAHRQDWTIASQGKQGAVTTVKFLVNLPIVQENFTRQLQMADGEQVVYIDSELESLLGFDRPINWGEHATIAAPFLEPEKLAVDLSGTRSKTRDHATIPQKVPYLLASFRDFTWPMAPTMDGGVRDIRSAPAEHNAIDHVTTLMDPSRKLVFVTALNTARNYLLGYLFRSAEYPWLQDWQSYTTGPRLNRGLEFATQPFDVPRHDVIELNRMFDAPVYRWLPAKSKISSRMIMFWTRTPEGMTHIDDVRLEGGNLIIEDRAAGKRVTLAASLGM
jgi:hypothetical protein